MQSHIKCLPFINISISVHPHVPLLLTVPHFHLRQHLALTAFSLWGAAKEVALPFTSQGVDPGPKISQPDSPLRELDSSFLFARIEN